MEIAKLLVSDKFGLFSATSELYYDFVSLWISLNFNVIKDKHVYFEATMKQKADENKSKNQKTKTQA